jgi:hypothetical protein
VNRRESAWRQALATWLGFWFDLPSVTTLACMRIGVGIVLFYSLFLYSFDLISHFGPDGWANLAALRQADPVAWPFSLFDWVDAAWWIWTVHFTALLVAVTFTLGVLPPLTGALALLFYLSYGHRNPAVMVSLDGLLVMSLIYLSLAPSARVLSLLPDPLLRPQRHPLAAAKADPQRSPWGAFMLRVLQIQLCSLYFLSGLSSMAPGWLSGEALLHPTLLERGLPFGQEMLASRSAWTMGIAHGLTLLALFYGVLVWLRRFRYLVVLAACLAHLVVGIAWGLQAYNTLMIVLNLAFVDSHHLEAVRARVAPLLALPWLPPPARP